MTDERQEKEHQEKVSHYLDWIDSELQHFSSYHDHKERMAWIATALYVPAVIVFGQAASDEICGGAWRWVLTALLVGACSYVLMFLSMQFNRRWVAADVSKGLRRARECVISSPTCVEDNQLTPVEDFDVEWPHFITAQVEAARTPRQLRDNLGGMVRGATFTWCRFACSNKLWQIQPVEWRTRTEAASYGVVVLGTAIGIGAIWI